MNTSYFGKSKDNPNAVSIACFKPHWFKGRQYSKLAPTVGILERYKYTGDAKQYVIEYKKYILDKLDPQEVYDELGKDSILLCFEKSGQFCHRNLVANWFKEKLGIEVKEL